MKTLLNSQTASQLTSWNIPICIPSLQMENFLWPTSALRCFQTLGTKIKYVEKVSLTSQAKVLTVAFKVDQEKCEEVWKHKCLMQTRDFHLYTVATQIIKPWKMLSPCFQYIQDGNLTRICPNPHEQFGEKSWYHKEVKFSENCPSVFWPWRHQEQITFQLTL